MKIPEIATTVIISLGGTAGLLIGFSKFFAKLFTAGLEEKIKSSFQKEIAEFNSQLEILRTISLRYSGKQFEYYNKLWSSLQDLRMAGDELWKTPNASLLAKFSIQLKRTRDEVEKYSLLIDDNDYSLLKEILKFFLEYEVAKRRLIDYFDDKEGEDSYDISLMIAQTRSKKEEFEKLLASMRYNLKHKIQSKP